MVLNTESIRTGAGCSYSKGSDSTARASEYAVDQKKGILEFIATPVVCTVHIFKMRLRLSWLINDMNDMLADERRDRMVNTVRISFGSE